MTEDKILTKEEVLRDGVCFEDELDWGGEYYEQIVCENESGEEVPYTGLAYDLYPDGQLEFYGYIDNGYRHGLAVYFYSNGKNSFEDMWHSQFGGDTGLEGLAY